MTGEAPGGPGADGDLPSGPGAAAILSAALGCATFAVVAFAADVSPAIKSSLALWKPSGPLSGVSDVALAVWLVGWFLLSRLWAKRQVDLGWINTTSFALLGVGLLLTFPPVMDLLQGK